MANLANGAESGGTARADLVARAMQATATRTWVAVALALLCGIVAQSPNLLLGRATPNLDFWVHYNYAREFAISLDAGIWRPRWAWNAQGGLGEPGLLYYSPLYYYLSWAASKLAGGNVWIGMQLVEAGAAMVLGLSVWRLCADYASRALALLAIPLAIFAPMLCLLHLGFNGYPWATATAPLGLLTWALLRPVAAGKLLDIPAILALALTICMHTVTGLMAVIMVASVALPVVLSQPLRFWTRRAFWSPALTVIGGLALSAWYLLPAFASQGLIDAGVWRENYTPFNAFSLSTVTAAVLGVRWFAFQWPISLIAFATCVLALWIVRRERGEDLPGWFAPSAAIAGVTFVLSTELSYPLWLIDSPLRNVQFPHRFVTLLVALAPFLLVMGLAARPRIAMASGVLAVLGLASLAMGSLVVARAAAIDGEVIDSREPLGPYVGLDEYRTVYTGSGSGVGLSYDWQAQCDAVGATCSPRKLSNGAARWRIEAASATTLRLPLHYFPSWLVTANGRAVEVRPDPERGLARMAVPAGSNEVSVRWAAMPAERAGMWLSLLTALLLAAISVRVRTGRARRAALRGRP